MNEERRERLLLRLDRYPLLQMLLLEKRFRLAVLFLMMGLIGGVLFVIRLWTLTPPGFSPRVRISGLDWVQSRSLARTARAREADQRFEEAAFAWQAALSNYPVNQEYLRGALGNDLNLTQTTPAGLRVAMRQ